jgi:hypothetical protein
MDANVGMSDASPFDAAPRDGAVAAPGQDASADGNGSDCPYPDEVYPGCPCDVPVGLHCCGGEVLVPCTEAGVWGKDWIVLDAGSCEVEYDDAGRRLLDHCV